jgi:hypothetical protein
MTTYLRNAIYALLLVATASHAAGAHTHGDARLDVAVDGPTITLKLESPLDSLVGFERAPKNDAERARVREMAQALRSGELFVPTAAARCRLERAELASPVLAPELLGEKGAAPAAKTGDEHAEIESTLVYRCEEPKALAGIDVMMFDWFKRLRRVEVQLAGPKGQSKQRLTAKSRQIRW